MSTSKSKNIIIIVLLLLNAFLLAIFVFDKTEAARAREAEVTALINVLKEKGISMSEDIDFDTAAPLPCTVLRDEERDNKLIDSFIDYSYREDLGGNVIFYSSDRGEAMLHGTGVIDLIFNEELPNLSGDLAEAAEKFMGRKGVELFPEHADETLQNDGASLLIPCGFEGFCVYNSKLSFAISGDRLMMISGTRVFNGEVKEKNEELIDSVSAIMHFLDYIRSDGYICSSINGLEAGYFLNVAVSGESSLRPVWMISTDTGEVYINAVSGKTETMPA